MAPKTLLLVEDSFTIQKLVESTFKSAGYQVTIANHAREGIASLPTVSPDIILADASMPEMDGFQLCEVIRSTQGFERIPVLLLTSRFAAYDEIQGQRSGVTAYLAKPFDSYSLLALVQQLVDNPSPQIDGTWLSATADVQEGETHAGLVNQRREDPSSWTSNAASGAHAAGLHRLDSHPFAYCARNGAVVLSHVARQPDAAHHRGDAYDPRGQDAGATRILAAT